MTSLVLALLASPTFAQKKYTKMTLDEAMADLGDDNFKLPNCRKTPRIKCVPYRSELRSVFFWDSDAEEAKKRAHNRRVRDAWMRENLHYFKTPSEKEKEKKVRALASTREKVEDVQEEINDKIEKQIKREKKLEELKKKYDALQSSKESLDSDIDAVEAEAATGDFNSRKHERLSEKKTRILRRISSYNDKASDLEGEIKELLGEIGEDSKALGKLTKEETELQGMISGLERMIPGEVAEKQDKFDKASAKRIDELDRIAADAALENIMDEEKFAEAMLKDVNDLQKDLGLNEKQMDYFGEKIKAKFNNSLLQDVIKDQMAMAYEASLDNMCSAVNQCEKGSINDSTNLKESFINSLDKKIKESSSKDK